MRHLPPFDLPGGSKTLTVSPYGNVVMINQDYDLLYSDLRNEGSARVPRELPVDCSGWDREFKDGKFNNIEFNSEGNILLVWSENSIGFLAIPTKNAPDGSFNDSMMAINPCPFCELLSDNDVVRDGSVKVLKVAFHPLSSYHVVVLLSNNTLLLTDTLSDVSREFPLRLSMLSSPVKQTRGKGDDSQFVSFCFGGDYDWMKLAVLLITADGQIFFLCPLLPSGAVVPKTTIDSLYAWVEEEGTPKGVSGATAAYMSKELRKYLDSLFRKGSNGSATGRFDNEIGEFVAVMGDLDDASVTQADIRSANVVVEASDDLLWEEFSPLLQGPLPMQGAEGNAAACDICVPQRCRAPVILVASKNGTVEMWTAQEGSAGAFMRPAWSSLSKMLGGAGDNGTRFAPAMQLLERISVPSSLSLTPRWSLCADPVHSHYFHLSDCSSGAVYLIMCNWLNRILSLVDEAASDALAGTAIDNGDSGDGEGAGELAPSSICSLIDAVRSTTGDGVTVVDRHCGASVLSDAMLGHIAVHRTSEGVITTNNITTAARLHQYKELIDAPRGRRRDGKSTTGAGAAGDVESEAMRRGVPGTNVGYDGLGRGSFEKRARFLIETVKKGLETVPLPPAEDDYDDTLEATKKKHLLAASKHLNQHAILPLEDLAHRIVSALDGIKDIYGDQMRFLDGPKGFKRKLWDLHHVRKAELTGRIESIGERLLKQRARSKELMARYAALNARKATVQEKEYAKQLEQWRSQLGTMQGQLTSLGGMVKVCTGGVLLHADGRAASKGSYRASRGGPGEVSPSAFSRLSIGTPSPAKTEASSMFQSPRQVNRTTSTSTSTSSAGAAGVKKQTPLERRRRAGGGGLGAGNVSRLTNRMSSLNMSSTGAGTPSSSSSVSHLGHTSTTAPSLHTSAGAGAGLNMGSILSSGAYERGTLSSEEVSYADDLIKAQSATIADSERQASELELLVSELKELRRRG